MIGTSVGAAAPLITVNRTVCPPIVTVITAAPALDVVTPTWATRSPAWTTTGPCTVATFGLLLDATPTRSATAGAPRRRMPTLAAVLGSTISTPANSAGATETPTGAAAIAGVRSLPAPPTTTVSSRTSPSTSIVRVATPDAPVWIVICDTSPPAGTFVVATTAATVLLLLVAVTSASAAAGCARSLTPSVCRLPMPATSRPTDG